MTHVDVSGHAARRAVTLGADARVAAAALAKLEQRVLRT